MKTSTIPLSSRDWRGHPDRPCKDDDRYSELRLTTGPGMVTLREALCHACLACPVYMPCLRDVLAQGKMWNFYGIQAGKQGKT